MKFLQIAFFLFLSLNICYGQSTKDSSIHLKRKGLPSEQAFNFSGITSTGQSINLTDFRGKYVLLDFWASWCHPCRKFNPELIKLYNLYKLEAIEFIGIASDVGKEKKWKEAISKDKISLWPQMLDDNIAIEYSVYSIPQLILIDPSGKIINRFGGIGQPKASLKFVLKKIFSVD